MTNPPSSLPSPTPSSSSGSHPHYQSIHQVQHSAPPRAPSAASGISIASGREGVHRMANGGPAGDKLSPTGYADYSSAHQLPHGHPYQQQQQQQQIPSAFFPQLTSSPPPHPPPYVPPPQHAMAPDPIHSGAQGLLGVNQMPGPPTGAISGLWPAGPPQPNGWRGSPAPGQLAGYPGPQLYSRGALPNGHQANHLDRTPYTHGLPPRSGSSHGEGRERRRDRDRREKDEDRGEREDDEVITTIFVVGFPDDMLEREFQNIFTFSPGFEAATLKFPSGSSRREPSAALLAELTQLAATQQAAQAAGEELPPGFEDAMAAMTMAATATASTSTSTTPSAAISLTPSAPSGPVLGNQPNLPTRRQTIGFARFRTRADALAAREHLQGRKIDVLSGATLKAEMAKKNLHTKRTTSGEELVGLLLRSGRLASLVNQTGANSSLPSQQVQPGYGREAWDAWSVEKDRQTQRQSIDDARAMPPPPVPVAPSGHNIPSGATSIQQNQNQNATQGGNGNSTMANFHPSSVSSTSSTFNPAAANNGQNPYSSAQSNLSASPALSAKSPTHRPSDSKALLALAEEADELEGWSVNGALGMGIMDGYQPPRRLDGSAQRGFAQAGSGYGGGFAPRQGLEAGYGTSPPGGSDNMSETGRGLLGGSNPADQNPPINTLYVGNLPAISPPTHPPNFLEESLRALFARCQGFKRMSFRQKINGPMCFVEFEEVGFASQAIKDLYGHNLGGLVKGGIRLSYSKNSLGQRGNGHPSALNTSMFGGIAHTVALAGMSMTSPTSAAPHLLPPSTGGAGTGAGGSGSMPIPISASAGAGYGLQLHQSYSQPGSGGHQPPASAPIPDMPRDVALSPPNISQGTSLSPTAQPFNSSLPLAASPRGRFFDPNGPSAGAGNGSGSGSAGGGVPIPAPSNNANAFQPFQSGSAGSNSNQSSTSTSGPSGPSGPSPQQFSPVSSPIRTPASFSWLSSGGTGNNHSAAGAAAYGYEFAGSAPLGSLNGAASAWGQAHHEYRRE